MTKTCRKCLQTKGYADFYPRGDKKGTSPQSRCKVCIRQQTAEYRKKNGIEQRRKYGLKRSFGISQEFYNDLFSSQEGKCSICEVHQSELKRALSVDHCHDSGKIRGLLCAKCNTALGLFGDRADNLKRATSYIEKHMSELAAKSNVVLIKAKKVG